jgi:hypothetical protein
MYHIILTVLSLISYPHEKQEEFAAITVLEKGGAKTITP